MAGRFIRRLFGACRHRAGRQRGGRRPALRAVRKAPLCAGQHLPPLQGLRAVPASHSRGRRRRAGGRLFRRAPPAGAVPLRRVRPVRGSDGGGIPRRSAPPCGGKAHRPAHLIIYHRPGAAAGARLRRHLRRGAGGYHGPRLVHVAAVFAFGLCRGAHAGGAGAVGNGAASGAGLLSATALFRQPYLLAAGPFCLRRVRLPGRRLYRRAHRLFARDFSPV